MGMVDSNMAMGLRPGMQQPAMSPYNPAAGMAGLPHGMPPGMNGVQQMYPGMAQGIPQQQQQVQQQQQQHATAQRHNQVCTKVVLEISREGEALLMGAPSRSGCCRKDPVEGVPAAADARETI